MYLLIFWWDSPWNSTHSQLWSGFLFNYVSNLVIYSVTSLSRSYSFPEGLIPGGRVSARLWLQVLSLHCNIVYFKLIDSICFKIWECIHCLTPISFLGWKKIEVQCLVHPGRKKSSGFLGLVTWPVPVQCHDWQLGKNSLKSSWIWIGLGLAWSFIGLLSWPESVQLAARDLNVRSSPKQPNYKGTWKMDK